MKTIGTLLLSAILGINIYNYKYDTNIVVEYMYQPRKVYVNVNPKPLTKTDTLAPTMNQRFIGEIKSLEGERMKYTKSPAHALVFEYIVAHAHLAIEVEKMYDIPAELCIAQAIHESGGGISWLAVNANNHFGIKAMKGLPFVKPKKVKWAKFESVDDAYMTFGRVARRLVNGLGLPKGKIVTAHDIARTAYAGKNNWDYERKCNSIIQTYNIKEVINKLSN